MDNKKREEVARFLRDSLVPRKGARSQQPVIKINKLVLVISHDDALSLVTAIRQALKDAA